MNRLTNLFGGKKNGKPAPKAKARKQNGYFLELDESTEDAAAVTTSDTPPLKAEPVAPQPEAPAATSPAPTAAPTPQPEAVKPAPAPVATKPAAPAVTPPGLTFAPNFLLTPSQPGSRRRPGPSMNPFMDIARQIRQSRPE